MKLKECPKLPIILYDPKCVFCTRFKEGLDKLDIKKEITKESIYNKNIYLCYPDLKKEECEKNLHFINKNGNVYQGSECIPQLIKYIPLVSKLSWLLDSQAGQKALNIFYDRINKYRNKIVKECPNCK